MEASRQLRQTNWLTTPGLAEYFEEWVVDLNALPE